MMKKIILGLAATTATIGSVTSASAAIFDRFFPPRPPAVSVPEIDASTGLLAMAAVFAATAFVWERNRRQMKTSGQRDNA